jgi:hypothetical protein
MERFLIINCQFQLKNLIMNSAKRVLVVSIMLLMFLASCDVLQQVNQVSNLAKCDFKLESVQNLNLA